MESDFSVAVKSGSPARVPMLVGLAIVIGWPLLLVIPSVSNHQITDVHNDLVNLCTKWIVVLILGVIAFSMQRRSGSEFGIRRPRWRDVLASIAGVFVALVLSGAATRFVSTTPSPPDLRKLAAVPIELRIAVVLTSAICEEFIYRGFGIEALASLTGHRWLAGVLSLFLFTVSHAGLYGMSVALIVPGLVGAVLTGLYLWRHNLLSCMLMHAIIDGLFIVIIPAAIQGK